MQSVRVTITVEEPGRISVEIEGPLNGKAGLLALLDAAREVAEQMT
jgi:hypothetical protein